MKKFYYLAAALACTSMAITSCSDDETYDFPGDPYNRVYVADYSSTGKIVVTPVSIVASLEKELPAKCNQAAKSDIKVTFIVDNSLIDAYNEENGTSYLAVPEQALAMENATVTIPAGAMMSAENCIVKLTDDQTVLASLNDDKGYIIPVRIDKMEGGNAQLSTNMNNVSYFTLEVSHDNIDADATAENRKGTLVTDRSGWSLLAPAEDGSALFDGDASNYVELNAEEVIIDLGKEYTFDGILAIYGWGWGSYVYNYNSMNTGTGISTSTDNVNYTSWGETKNSGNMMGFVGAVTARYIKLKITEGYYGTEFTCGDFNIYAL